MLWNSEGCRHPLLNPSLSPLAITPPIHVLAMSAASVRPLSSDTATDGLEVSLFLNPVLLFSCYIESCSDQRIRQLAEADAARTRRQQDALGRLQDTQPEAAQRMDAEERLIDDMIALADSTADIHLLNRPSNQPPHDAADSPAPPSIPTLLYSSLLHKRVQVLQALHAATRADIEHFHRRHSSHAIAAPPAALHRSTHPSAATTAATANRRAAASSSAASSGLSSCSSVPPLLRWSLLSLFPLIDSVSRVDPSLRAHTVRLLVGVLQSSPPLSLFHEDDSTIALLQSHLSGGTDSSVSSDVHSARIGLAIQRGQLRHILAAVEPLLTASEDDDELNSTAAQIDLQPYLLTLQHYAASKPLLSALIEDTLICQWRHHTVAQIAHHSPQPSLLQTTATESAGVVVAPLADTGLAAGDSSSANSAAALMASYTTPLLGAASQREESATALDFHSPPTAPSIAPPTTSQIMPSSASALTSTLPSSTCASTASRATATAPPLSSAPSPSLPSYGCLASDGVYHYIHNQSGLHKFGAGVGGSIQGHLYRSERQPFASLVHALPPSLSSVLSSEACHHVYGGWLAHLHGSLLFRSSLFILSQPELLAVRIDSQTLSAVELVWADSDSYERVREDSSRGSVRWFNAMTDGDHLIVLREQHRDRHCFYLDRFVDVARSSAAPPASAAAVASNIRSSCMRLVSSTLLPCGFTQLPSAHRYTRSLSALLSPYQFCVGQKVDAKDSINKWCASRHTQPHTLAHTALVGMLGCSLGCADRPHATSCGASSLLCCCQVPGCDCRANSQSSACTLRRLGKSMG